MIFTEQSPNLEFNKKLLESEKVYEFKSNLNTLSIENIEHLKKEITEYYFNLGWGLKIIARNVLGITYSNCRTIFSFLGLEFKKGRSITTDFVANFRKDKAKSESDNKIGFRSDSLKRFNQTTSRGVQGYYFNKSTNSYVWLRSTYEYIYAKFLNKIGANWKTEQTYYYLSDGTKYSPDFYLYDKDWNLEKIIEIKGYFDCRAYKVNLLKEEFYKDSNISIILVKDIQLYIEENNTYPKELKTWKLIRKSKEFISQK